MRTPALLLATVVAVGCSWTSQSPEPATTPAERVELPGPSNAPPLQPAAGQAEELPGIDISALSAREKERYWRLVTQLYAPCASEAVSLAACVKEKRACGACAPAVQLLADKIHEGALAEQAQAIYGIRFGPNTKPVELADSPTKGPPTAPVVIVEWFDFECPHCKIAMPLLDKLVEKYAGSVRLVKKFYPLRSHSRAEPAARAAIAAHNQGRYWEMERMVFSHPTELADGDLERYAKELNLDVKRWKADLTSERTNKILERDKADADKFGLSGTPFILINGREFDLSLFHFDSDLDPWVALEAKLRPAGGAGAKGP